MNVADSGFKAVMGCAASLFWSGAFIFGFPGVMAPYWKEQFSASQGAIGSIFFFVLAAAGLFMFFVGKWQEKVGIKRTITAGVIITSLNVLLLNLATSLYMIYAFAFIAGASSCLIYIPSLTCVQRWYPEKRGLVSGAVNITFGLSAALTSPLFIFLVDTIGYSLMLYSTGVISLITGVLASQWTNLPPEENTQVSADRISFSTTEQLQFDAPMTLKEIIQTRSFKLLWICWAFQGAAGVAMVPLSTAYGISKNHSIESAVVILMAFNFASGLMRLLSGLVSDHIGRTLTMSIGFFISGLAYVGLLNSSSLFWMSVFAALIGFAFATLFTVSAPLVTDCFGIQNFGAVFGIVFTAYGFMAGLLGPALSGFVLDLTNDFSIVFLYLGAFSFLASILILFVKPVIRTNLA
jgi:OFA family oxalate/formate antiporter-like MFS transporter